MEEGYSICLNKWALDKEIKNELGLLLIISSLCAENGYCYASNQYFAELFDITDVSVSTKIKKLEDRGYIEIEYIKRGCEVISRYIRLKKILIDDYKNFKPTIKKKFKENNINNNNNKEIYNNNLLYTKKVKKVKKEFIPPTLEEIKQYCLQRKNNVNYQTFYDYYNENDWKDNQGKQVNNWKLKVISWESNTTKPKNNSAVKKSSEPSWLNEKIDIKEMTEEEKLDIDKYLMI